jgi:ribosomal-protein-serine acetyltransferase
VSAQQTRDPMLIDFAHVIETDRLILRVPVPANAKDLFQAAQETPDLKFWIPMAQPELPTLEKCELFCRKSLANFILRTSCPYLIFDHDRMLHGLIAVHRMNFEYGIFEIGYWLRSSSSGQGIMTEATNMVTQYLFRNHATTRVQILCNASNTKSGAVAERLGFIKEGVLRNNDHVAARSIACRDENIYARTTATGLPELNWKSKFFNLNFDTQDP